MTAPIERRVGRHANLLRHAMHDLARERGKTAAVTAPLALIVAVALSAGMIRDGFERDAQLSIEVLPDITVQRMVGGRAERVGMEIISSIEEVEQVRKVVPRVWGFVPVTVDENVVAFTLMGIDLERMPLSELVGESIEEGRFLAPGDSGKVVIGKVVSSNLGARVGETIRLKDTFGNEDDFEVVGIFKTAVQVYTADMLITSIEDARKFFVFAEEEASDFCVYLEDPFYDDTVAERITHLFQGARTMTREALSDLTQQAYGGRSGVFQLMWVILLLACLLTAWCQATNIALGAKREIGILKALGWGTADVIETRLWGALWMATFSCLLGAGLGFLYVYLGAPGMKGYFIGWTRLYPEFPLPIAVKWKTLVTVWIAGTLPLVIASVVPAWLTGIIDPDEAIRD